MSKNKFSYKNVVDLLIKKASGFYYNEEQYEYEKTQNKSDFPKINSNNQNKTTQLTFLENNFNFNNNNENSSNQNNQNLTLTKKKVTTHYVSPDMLAIKILLEIYGEKVKDNDNITNLSNSELIDLKNKLLKELRNEDS